MQGSFQTHSIFTFISNNFSLAVIIGKHFLHGLHSLHLRDNVAFTLLSCSFRNLLPTLNLLISFRTIKTHYGMFHRYRNNAIGTKLYCFLDDEIHFLTLCQTLGKSNLYSRFVTFCKFFKTTNSNSAFGNSSNFCQSTYAVITYDLQFITGLHSENLTDMLSINASDSHFFII